MSRPKSYSGKKPSRWPDAIFLAHAYIPEGMHDDDPPTVESENPYLLYRRTTHLDSCKRLTCVAMDRSPSAWWISLFGEIVDLRSCIIYAHDLPKLWTAIDFWDRLESGDVTLQPPYARGGISDADDSVEIRNGVLVAADPPAFAITWIRGCGCMITWIDLRNFGWQAKIRDHTPVSLLAYSLAAAGSLVDTVEQYDLGGPRMTAGSQAMEAFRVAPLPYYIHPTQDDDASRMERLAIYGGRCEARYVGLVAPLPEMTRPQDGSRPTQRADQVCSVAYHLDFSSLYPSVMHDFSMPTELMGMYSSDSLREFACTSLQHVRIADCTIITDVPCYPLRIDGRVVYPVGMFRTILPGPDFDYAYAAGRVAEFHGGQLYRTKPIFTSIVGKLWGLRVKHSSSMDDGVADVCKRLMNALSGKFNQREQRWESRPEIFATQPYGSEWIWSELDGVAKYHRTLAWNVQELVEGPLAKYSSPIITAHIMALGRFRLQAVMNCLPADSLLYLDTDSVVVTSAGYERLCGSGMVESMTLGKLRLKDVWQRLDIHGSRHYNGDGKTVCSGFAAGSRYVGNARWEVPARRTLEAAIAAGDPCTATDGVRQYTFGNRPSNRVPTASGWTKPIEAKGWVYDECRGSVEDGD